jgi:hypothetical protein
LDTTSSLVAQRKIGTDVSVLFQLANAYLYKLLPASRFVHRVVCAGVMAPISLTGVALGALLPANADLYLDQAVLAPKGGFVMIGLIRDRPPRMPSRG